MDAGSVKPKWMRWRYLIAVGVLAGVVVGVAIGASRLLGDSPEDNAIRLVPADAAFYATVHLDPSLGQKREMKSVLDHAHEVGAGDGSGDSLEDAIGAVLGRVTPVDYERDLKPYMGDQLALYARPGETVTLLAATDDPRASLEAMHRLLEHEYDGDYYRIVSGTHRGQPYEHVVYAEDGESAYGASAFTIVDGFVVLGGELGVRASIDARGGASLAGSDEFTEARSRLSDNVLGAAYLDAEPFAEAARADEYSGDEEVTQLEWAAAIGPTTATLAAGDGDLELELASSTSGGDAAPLQDPSALLETFPADAIGAISLGDFEGPLREGLDGGYGGRLEELREGVAEVADLDLSSDVASWLGALGAYATGEDDDTVEGAVVAETRSPASSSGTLDRIEDYYSSSDYYYDYESSVYGSEDGLGFDVPAFGDLLQVRGDEDRVIAGTGASGFSTERALDAEGNFGESAAYGRAEDLLGDYEPFLVIDAPPVRNLLVEATGAYYDEGYMEDVRPWVESLDTVAAGVRSEDGGIRIRLVADVR